MQARAQAQPLALIVMPEGTDAGLVGKVVADLGFETRHYRDAGSALEAVEYDHPALVVHGWDLPDMDVVTFHGAVRQRAGERSVMPLAIAPDRESADLLAGTADADEIIVRPLEREELALRLGRLAAGMERAKPERPRAGRKKRTGMQEKERAAVPPARPIQPDDGGAGLQLRVIGLGQWGVRGAELFDRQGIAARGVDTTAAVHRSSLPEGRRHRITADSEDRDAARAMAVDASLGEALRADADAEIVIVIADLGVGSGSLAATLLARIAAVAPRAGRLAVARLPGLRSGPEERALALVALNALLQGPPSGIFLVQHADSAPTTDADADPAAPLYRLLDLWALAGDTGPEADQPLSPSSLARLLGTAGFLGWRETTLTGDDIAPESRSWHEVVAAPAWQPRGFSWSDAQAVLPIAKLPWSWLEGGGRRQFERFVQAAWDEAAPCSLAPALYASDPASAALVSAGMPYPRGVITLRDSVEADRARLAEKRRKAEGPIPLGEGFLPAGPEILVAPASTGPRPAPAPIVQRPAPEIPRVRAPEPEIPRARAPEPEIAPARASEPEPRWEPETEPESPVFIELPEFEPAPMPPAYESALALVRRIFSAKDLSAEVDVGEVRYALYDLLEILREEPHALLPEVFRPELEEWFERHHVNVAVLAILTGDLMKGSLSEVIDLGTAALLHDLGMQPTRATWDVDMKLPPKVFEGVVRAHPEMGFRRLQEVTGMTSVIARMVLEEHERMDGTGYTEGLAGDAIDPGARILAVCDTLEALTHPRPYRDAVSLGEALGRLQVLAQYTLDPAVVQALSGELTGLLRRGAREPERR